MKGTSKNENIKLVSVFRSTLLRPFVNFTDLLDFPNEDSPTDIFSSLSSVVEMSLEQLLSAQGPWLVWILLLPTRDDPTDGYSGLWLLGLQIVKLLLAVRNYNSYGTSVTRTRKSRRHVEMTSTEKVIHCLN